MGISLEDLPNEILVQILSYIDSLQTLDTLLTASPCTFRLFSQIGAETLDCILEPSTASQVTTLIRVVAILRAYPSSNVQAGSSLDSFQRRYIAKVEGLDAEQLKAPPLAAILGPKDAVNPTDPEGLLVRSLIVTARRAAWLADAAVDYFRHNLVAAEPQHLADDETSNYNAGGLPWRRHFKGRPYVLLFGVLRWEEQQRLHRALWRLEIAGHLQQAIACNAFGWTEFENRDTLHDPLALLDDLFGDWEDQFDELLAMAHFIIQRYPHSIAWRLPSYSPRSSNADSLRTKSIWPVRQIDETRPEIGVQQLDFDSDGMRQFRTVTRPLFSPIRHAPSQWFYPFGIPFWDRQTLRDLQLYRGPLWDGGFAADEPFTWRSLLSQVQILAVEEALDNGLQDHGN